MDATQAGLPPPSISQVKPSLAPSLFATGLLEGALDGLIAGLTKDAAFPKRAGRPEEFAWLAAIVRNPMLNGQTIRLDGGQRFAPR